MRRQDEPVDAERSTDVHQVDPGYFGVLGMPLVAGRLFATSGNDEGVLVNETFARRWLGGTGAVGTAIVLGGKTCGRVVGVIRDARCGGSMPSIPVVFEPLSGTTMPRLLLPSTPGLSGAVVAAVQRLDSRIRVRTTPMQEVVYRHLDEARLASRLAATLGLVSLVLAIVGVSACAAISSGSARARSGSASPLEPPRRRCWPSCSAPSRARPHGAWVSGP